MQMTSDEQAFQHVLDRLQDEVGTILKLTSAAGKTPYWALIRMLFPIAEAVADLIYQHERSSAKRLAELLRNEFESVRAGYREKAATITLLYRHSLIHQDMPRGLHTGCVHVGWAISNSGHPDHMTVLSYADGGIAILFDSTSFYDDLVIVCTNARDKDGWNGKVMQRYNDWLTLELDTIPRPSAIEKAAIPEIQAMAKAMMRRLRSKGSAN